MHRVLLLLVLCSSATFADSIFDFNNDDLDTYTPFTDTSNGVSATFSSNGDPGGFSLTFYRSPNSSGNILFQPGPAGLDNLSLFIQFSQPLSNIELTFILNGTEQSVFNLRALLGSAPVGQVSATGLRLPGAFFPEGRIAFTDSTFDNVILSSSALDFAIDNVSVSPANAAVPEPGTLGLSGIFVFGAVAFGRRISACRKLTRLPVD
jgi:hypothetical protein